MIRLFITLAALLAAAISNSQVNSGKATQAEFNGKLCDIGRGLCTINAPTSI